MVGIVSDIGMVRNLNEDYAKYLECNDFKIYVVADGMGGHNAGEVASKMAAEGIVNYVGENFSENTKELIPEAAEGNSSDTSAIAFSIGFVIMMILDVALS